MITPVELAAHESEIARLMAVVAALEAQAVLDQEDVHNVHIALESSRLIGAAIGIVMVTRRTTEEAAFQALRHASQTTNRKLRDIASDVVLTGALESPSMR